MWRHGTRKESLMGGNKGSTDIEMVFKCCGKHHKRQPLAHIWKWFLWDFSQEFPNLSPDYINVVFGSECVCCLRAVHLCAPLAGVGRTSPHLQVAFTERSGVQEACPIGVEPNWAKKGTLSKERKKSWVDSHEAEHLFSLCWRKSKGPVQNNIYKLALAF